MWIRRITMVAVLAVAAWGTAALGQPEEAEPEAPRIEERAASILKDAGEYLASAESFSFRAHAFFDEVLPTGQKLQYVSTGDVFVRRPDRLRVDVVGELRNYSFWYDGKTITLMHRDKKVYSTSPAPGNIDEALDFVMERFGFTVPLADLVYSHPAAIIEENVETAFLAGTHEFDGRTLHHVAARQENIDWQIWIEDGRQVVPRKLVITYKDEPGAPQYSALLTDWDFSPRLADRLFRFEAPDGVDRIEFLPQPEEEDPGQAKGEEKP